MRMTAKTHGCNWFIWHVEQACERFGVLWVDDETCEWAEWNPPFEDLYKAKSIRIIASRKTILINPIDDRDERVDDAETKVAEL